jgi:hypothetical protein
MKFGIRKFINVVPVGFEDVEVLKEVIPIPSFSLIQLALNMIDCLMGFIFVSYLKGWVHGFSWSLCSDMIHLQRSNVMDNDLLCPAVIFIPVMCPHRIVKLVQPLDHIHNIAVDVTISEHMLHVVFPFMPIFICQMVMVSHLKWVSVEIDINSHHKDTCARMA